MKKAAAGWTFSSLSHFPRGRENTGASPPSSLVREIQGDKWRASCVSLRGWETQKTSVCLTFGRSKVKGLRLLDRKKEALVFGLMVREVFHGTDVDPAGESQPGAVLTETLPEKGEGVDLDSSRVSVGWTQRLRAKGQVLAILGITVSYMSNKSPRENHKSPWRERSSYKYPLKPDNTFNIRQCPFSTQIPTPSGPNPQRMSVSWD